MSHLRLELAPRGFAECLIIPESTAAPHMAYTNPWEFTLEIGGFVRGFQEAYQMFFMKKQEPTPFISL